MNPLLKRRRSAISWTALAAVAVVYLLAAGSAFAATLRAQVDRQSMAENETLNLEVVYDGRVSTDAIDFESLLSDFQILGIRPSSETRIENFKRSSRTAWQMTLLPKRTGLLEIPAFQIKGERTQAIRIRVVEAPDSPELGAPLSARLIPDRSRAFIDEQILVRIQISAAGDVSGLRGSALELPGADVSLLQQRDFQRVVGGDPYQVTELVYAVFAQSPGKIAIPALEYTGRFRRGRTLIARTRALEIEIMDPAQDAAAASKSPWLPVSGLAMASEWSTPPDSLRVGEPVTRTIRVASASQRAAAIPPIELSDGPYKIYPEQPSLKNTETSTGLLGTRIDAFVLVPTEAGTHTLPAIEIDWWNIAERRWEKARVPPVSISVAAATGTSAVPAPPNPLPVPGGAEAFSTEAPINGDEKSESRSAFIPESRALRTMLGVLTGLCLILAFVCVGLLRRVRALEKERSNPDEPAGSFRLDTESAAMKAVRRAIGARDAATLRSHLIEWARLRLDTDEVQGLDAVAKMLGDAELGRLLTRLDASLYAREAAFDAWDAIEAGLRRIESSPPASKSARASSLPPLYPSDTHSDFGASR